MFSTIWELDVTSWIFTLLRQIKLIIDKTANAPNGLRHRPRTEWVGYPRVGGHFDRLSTSVDNAWEQEKLAARIILENPADRASELQANTVRPAWSFIPLDGTGSPSPSAWVLGNPTLPAMSLSKGHAARPALRSSATAGCIILATVQDALLGTGLFRSITIKFHHCLCTHCST